MVMSLELNICIVVYFCFYHSAHAYGGIGEGKVRDVENTNGNNNNNINDIPGFKKMV